jgi:hypothetical protein
MHLLYAPSAQPEAKGHSQPGPARPGLSLAGVLITGPTVSTPLFHTPPFSPFPVNRPLTPLHPLLTCLSAAVTAAGCGTPHSHSHSLVRCTSRHGGRQHNARSSAPSRRIPSRGLEAQREDEEARTLAPAPAGRKVRPPRGHSPPYSCVVHLVSLRSAISWRNAGSEVFAQRGFRAGGLPAHVLAFLGFSISRALRRIPVGFVGFWGCWRFGVCHVRGRLASA